MWGGYCNLQLPLNVRNFSKVQIPGHLSGGSHIFWQKLLQKTLICSLDSLIAYAFIQNPNFPPNSLRIPIVGDQDTTSIVRPGTMPPCLLLYPSYVPGAKKALSAYLFINYLIGTYSL